jgi:Cu/Ag efflux pump CusA
MAVGVAQLRNASVNPYPEFGPRQVQIQTEALGLSTAEVEQLITVPMEQDLLNGIPWLDQIRSESVPGLSSIDLVFKPDTNVVQARQMVQERMTQAHALPNVGSSPVIIQPHSSTSRLMMIGLSSKAVSLVDLSVLARWKIKPRLMGVAGVANVAIWGQRDRQLQVQVDTERLRKNDVSLGQVIHSTGNALWVSPLTFVEASTPGTGGFIDTPLQRFSIQHILPITTGKDLSLVTIEETGGKIRIGDVASVVEGHQPLIGDAVLSSGPGLMLVVERLPDANAHDVIKGVGEALDALRPGLKGIDMDPTVYRADTVTQTSLLNLARPALVGLVLILLLVALVSFSWRMALVSVVTILLSLVAAAYVLYLFGATFNMMALAGLAVALGVAINDAVVGLAGIRRRLREHRGSPDSRAVAAVADGSSVVHGSLVYATLLILLAPLPFFFLDGVAPSFSRPLILSYALAVAVSTIVALTVAPALAFVLVRGERPSRMTSPLVRLAYWAFDRTVPSYVRRPRWVYATLALLILAGLTVVPQLGSLSLLPSPEDRNLLIHCQTAPGTSLSEMMRIMTGATQVVHSVPGVRDVGGHAGRAVTSDQVVDVNSGELWISLADSADYQATVAAIRRVLRGYPGLSSDLMTYPQDRLRTVQTGVGDALVVRVYGHDLDRLRNKAEEVRQLISRVDGVVQPRLETQTEEPTLEIEVSLPAAAHYGLKPGDVRRAAATLLAGLPVGNLYQEQKIFDVVVWSAPSTRSSPDNVKDLMIDAPTGGRVRLGDVAAVRVASYPAVIRHDATSRSLDVTANVNGRDLGSVLRDVKDRVSKVQMPLEYHAEVLSNRAQQQDQDRRTAALAVAVLIGMYLLLQSAFGSWRLATWITLTLPLAAVGGVLAASLVGGITSLGALIGLFMVLAIAARNVVLLVRDFQHLEATDGAFPVPDVVLTSVRDRFGPIVLTAAAVSAAVVPLLIFGRVPGTEVLYPMAAVVLGGLVTSTLVSVFVVPALYHRLSPATRREAL